MSNSAKLSQALHAAGVDEKRVAAITTIAKRATGFLSDTQNAGAAFVPGRIEFLGKHTDYCGGRSLVCTVDRGIVIVFAPRTDSTIAITLAATGEHAEFPLDPNLTPSEKGWTNYPMTVARRVARNFPTARTGMELIVDGDLPQAAGLSSSSAFVVATFLAISAVNRLEETPEYKSSIHSREDLGEYLGNTENGLNFGPLLGDRGVGTFGGSQDHTAILCSKPGRLSRYGFCPVTFEGDVPIPAGLSLVVAGSGVLAEKTGAARDAYNRASLSAREVLRVWNESTGRNDPTLAAAVRSAEDAVDRMHAAIDSASDLKYPAEYLRRRLTTFVTESETIIPAVTVALRDDDRATLANWIDLSQHNSEHLLGNQVPETIWLAKDAREHGAVAASAFGAGFGGSVWALVPSERAQSFAAEWIERYRKAFPTHAGMAQAFVTAAGPAAIVG